MKILITGGAGYIGSALVPRLLKQRHKVSVLDCMLYGNNISHFQSASTSIADIRDNTVLHQLLRETDCVVHLAAIVGDKACDIDMELTYLINHVAAVRLAEMAKNAGCQRFVFSSTCSVYGQNAVLLSEISELNPVSNYAESKILAERDIAALSSQHFEVSILRFGTIYGFSSRIRYDLVVNLLTAKAEIEKQIPIFGGSQWRPFVHVDDAAKAISHVIHHKRNGVYNVGSNRQNYQIKDIGKIIKKAIPEAMINERREEQDRRNYRVNFSKLKQTGYRAEWTIREGIKQVIKAIRSGRAADYQAAEYNNYRSLSNGAIDKLRRFKSDSLCQSRIDLSERTIY